MNVLLFLLISLAPLHLYCQLSADSLVALYAEKIGGKAAWQQIKSFRLEMEMQSSTRTGSLIHYMRKPNCYQLVFDFSGKQRILSYDGSTGYIQDDGKLTAMPADMQIEMREEADFFDELIFHREKNFPLQYLGEKVIADQAYHLISLKKSSRDVQTYYLHTGSLLLKYVEEYSEEARVAGILFKTQFPSYQRIGAVLFPREMLLYADDEVVATYEITQVVLNPRLPRKHFRLK